MITQDRLSELLSYDPLMGLFRWKVSRGTRAAGSVAGNNRPDGYIYIKVDKALYRQTRLIWLYVYGAWPKHHIDHINGDTSDDRFCNLREATRSQNLGNRKRNINSTTGFKGVTKRGSRYLAYINKDGTRIWLGYHQTPEEAHAAYMGKATELFGEFARSS